MTPLLGVQSVSPTHTIAEVLMAEGLPGVPCMQNLRLEPEEILDLILYLNTERIQAPM